jgi:hypothetical protein
MFRKSTLLAACAALILTVGLPSAFAAGKHETGDKEKVDHSDRHDMGDRGHDKHDDRGGDKEAPGSKR